MTGEIIQVERVSMLERVRRAASPWLLRGERRKLLEVLGAELELVVTRTWRGVLARLPGGGDGPALAATGRERGIRRGPDEPAATYARRLRIWWDAHRRRGSPYVMLEQLHAFFVDTLDPLRVDEVAHSGLRHQLADDGAIARDVITWDPAPAGEWAHIWVFYHLGDLPVATATLVTEAGDVIVTSAGDDLVAVTELSGIGAIAADAAELYLAIPREWSAAHIPYVTVVLLHGSARLWGYPVPVPTWGTWGTWQSTDPVVLIAE